MYIFCIIGEKEKKQIQCPCSVEEKNIRRKKHFFYPDPAQFVGAVAFQ